MPCSVEKRSARAYVRRAHCRPRGDVIASLGLGPMGMAARFC
jgi:hypothetical protein